MVKKQWTDEERKAFGEKMRRAKLDKQTHSTYPPEPKTNADPHATETPAQTAFLNVTRDNLVNEQDLVERIRREFDQGKNPKRLLVNSGQMMELLFNSPNTGKDITSYYYESPFGSHRIEVVPAKDLL